ncbi:MAG TPA: lycopene cyclase domain-containing protein, partial [Candidatus Methylacidiphilales bacterium]
MTYLGFHARFNLPASLLLAALLGWKGGPAWAEVGTALAVLVPVYLFATPWDNWAVQRGIWGFDEHRTGARVGWLPWEEYLFFGWQSLNVAGTVSLLFRLVPDWKRGGET